MTHLTCNAEKPAADQDFKMFTTAKSGLVLRDAASTDSKKLALIPNGSQVRVIRQLDNEVNIAGIKGKWTQIEYGATTGWVFGGFLSSNPIHKSAESDQSIIKARFLSFELGDASHFIFEDENHKIWDFSKNDSGIKFEQELPESKTNEGNQGWGSNPQYVNQWFTIHYEKKKMVIYLDGPEMDALVITSAKLRD